MDLVWAHRLHPNIWVLYIANIIHYEQNKKFLLNYQIQCNLPNIYTFLYYHSFQVFSVPLYQLTLKFNVWFI
jgi:hypothetical protein